MYSQAVLVNTNNDGGPTVRSNTTSTFYLLDTTSAPASWQVYKCITGTFTQINVTSVTEAANDVAYLEVQGTTLKSKQNGTVRNNFTDSAIDGTTVGGLYPGLHASGTSIIYDTYECGDFVTNVQSNLRFGKPFLFGPLGIFQTPQFRHTASSGQALTLSVSDSITMGDSTPVKSDSKPISDSITMADTKSLLDGKVLSDAFTLADAKVLLIGKVLSDAFTLADTKALLFGKILADSFTLGDALAKLAGKALADAIAMGDAKALLAGKVLSDALTMADAQALTLGRAFSDSFTLSDSKVLSEGKVLSDGITVSDPRAFSVSKPFADTFTLSDSATATLVLTIEVSDSFSLGDTVTTSSASTIECNFIQGCEQYLYGYDASTPDNVPVCGESIAGCLPDDYAFTP